MRPIDVTKLNEKHIKDNLYIYMLKQIKYQNLKLTT